MPRTERDGLPRSAGNRLLAVSPDDALALLEPDLRQLTLPQGVVCYGAGDPIDQVYFPHTGMISQLIATGDGDMVETCSIGREGAVGLQCGAAVVYPDHGADPGEIFHDFGGALRARDQSLHGAARSHHAVY